MDIRNEIIFWTQIMREHAVFQHTSLAPSETEAINATKYYMDLFNGLNKEAVNASPATLPILVNNCKTAVLQFIKFKKYMLTGLMTCNFNLGMTPSFLNHMINEAMEFMHVLDLMDGSITFNPILENIRIHKVWLPDASGHANAIASDLDAIESELTTEAKKFADKFDKLFKKAYEMYKMYERTGLENGSLYYFNQEVINTMNNFISFLNKTEKLSSNCNIFISGTFSPLIPNHMMREEIYYINKINQFPNKKDSGV